MVSEAAAGVRMKPRTCRSCARSDSTSRCSSRSPGHAAARNATRSSAGRASASWQRPSICGPRSGVISSGIAQFAQEPQPRDRLSRFTVSCGTCSASIRQPAPCVDRDRQARSTPRPAPRGPVPVRDDQVLCERDQRFAATSLLVPARPRGIDQKAAHQPRRHHEDPLVPLFASRSRL